MAGKFSQPRPNRDEEREIERAFRQVTGQSAPPRSRKPEPISPDTQFFDPITDPVIAPIPDPVIPTQATEDFDIVFEDDTLFPRNPLQPPEEPESESIGDKAGAFLGKAIALCTENKKLFLVGLCAVALVMILGFMSILFLSTSDPYEKTILNNVWLADVNVGGMTKEEAISAVKQATAHTYPVLDMVLDLQGNMLRLSPADTGVQLDVKAAVNAAYEYGRTGTKAEQEQAYQDSLASQHIIGLLPYLELNDSYIRNVLKEYAQRAGSTLTQTSYGLDGGIPDLTAKDFDPNTAPARTLVIRMGAPGIRFDVDSVYEQILDAYSLHSFLVTVDDLDTTSEPDPINLKTIYDEFYIAPVNASMNLQNYTVVPGTYGYGFDLGLAQKKLEQAEYGEEIRIPMEFIEPAVLNANMFFQDVLAEYVTTYKDRGNLQTNLALACQAINGKILNPGDTFSFNDVVGQRTSAKGYKYADDQIGTEKNRILGGGISQVSSALYYCALVADLEVNNRTAHSLIPGYSDYGLDAAVGWATPDLKFTNTLGLPIRIDAEASNGKVQISFLGTDEKDYFVAMDYEISGTRAYQTEYRKLPADNDDGYKDGDVIQEGAVGYVIKTFRLKYDDKSGALLSRDFVNTTQYSSVPRIIAKVDTPETTEPTQPSTEAPTQRPTEAPTEAPTATPSETPTEAPTETPTETPTEAPTQAPAESATEPPKEPAAPTDAPEEPASEPDIPPADTQSAASEDT